MVRNKIKSLLKMFDKSNKDAAESLGMPYYSFTNKINQRGFSTEELIKIAELTGTQLCFIDKSTGETIIKFDPEDIKKDTE